MWGNTPPFRRHSAALAFAVLMARKTGLRWRVYRGQHGWRAVPA